VSLRPKMYATVTIDVPAGELGAQYSAGGGRPLAVPEGAVVYTGSQKVVFRQEAPTVFDAIGVEVGPLLTGPDGNGFYPVFQGLQVGDRVVTTGSYLLDAETRVSAAAGSIYSGSGSKPGSGGLAAVRPTTPEDEEANARANLAKLSTPDRSRAEAQKVCPVLKNRLGGMGIPVKLLLKGQPVFLCCKGCEDEAKADPDRTLTTAEGPKPGDVAPAPVADRAAKIKANLARLGDEDRKLAEEQKYCPIERDNLLGKMGKPVKVMIEGRPVFLCCPSCEDDARAHPEKTLKAVEEQKARAKAETPSF